MEKRRKENIMLWKLCYEKLWHVFIVYRKTDNVSKTKRHKEVL